MLEYGAGGELAHLRAVQREPAGQAVQRGAERLLVGHSG
jgi:hypothetical protein